LAKDCGASGSDDCCASISVPGGSFTIGRGGGDSDDCACSACDGACSSCGSLSCSTDEGGVSATVSGFRLDRYEATVGRFRKFVEAVVATGWQPPVGSGKHSHLAGGGVSGESGWDATWPALPTTKSAWDNALECGVSGQQTWTWTAGPGANERRPINCVTWFRAVAFCIWDGGFLPTEAEWEYAASGGEERVYPWSSPPADATVDPTRASYGCLGDGVAGCSLADIVEVGSKAAGNGRWGHADLAGNLWELVLDWYAPSYAACSDCAQLAPATNRVIRGGTYNDQHWGARAANRHNHSPTVRGANVGVRCARAP
jgi:formylglycine-generating enzyme required for sulfatase activity